LIDEGKKEEKKAVGITELVAIISVMVSILVAGTSLLSGRGYVPSWWFDLSLVFLILFIFSVPIMIFWKPIYSNLSKWRLQRERDSVARGYFMEFEGLSEKLRRALYPISDLWNMIKHHYQTQYQKELGMLPLFVIERAQSDFNRIQNRIHALVKHCEGFNGSMRDFSLLIDEFNQFLEDGERQVQILSVYASEMKISETNPQVLKKYDEFREQYNIFLNDCMSYFQRLNQEFGQYTFQEHFEYVKKW